MRTALAASLALLFLCVPRPATQDAQPSCAVAREGDGNWPSFRGRRAAGVADGFETAVDWDVGDGTNVLWRVELPGMAHSSPVVWEGKLFVTTAVREAGEQELRVGLYGSIDSVQDEGPYSFELHCLDKHTGELLWSRSSWKGVPRFKRHPKSSYAASTPACDGQRVVAFYGTEGLYCYDLEGELIWEKDLGELDSGFFAVAEAQWGFASSPVLHGERVIVQCDVQGQSFVAVLDAADGEEIWRTNRDEVPTWSTPTVDLREGRSQVVLNGYKHIGGYDLETGAELWKLAGGGDIPVPTPIISHDLILVTNAHGGMAPIFAIDPMAEGTLGMDPEECEALAWCHPRRGNYMQTPLAYGDEAYFCSDGGILTCLDVASGEEHYRERLGSGRTGFSGSGVAADGKLYFCSEEGDVHVVAASRSFEQLAVNSLGEPCMSSPALSEGVLYYRSRTHLVAIAPQPDGPADDGHWPSFRGRRASGVAEGFETAIEWDGASGDGVAWRTPIPGLAHSSPVVWGDAVFVTTAVRLEGDSELSSLYGSPNYGAGDSVTDEGPHAFELYCLDRITGEMRWKRTAHEGVPRIKRHPKASHANSSPACDAERVVAFFGSEGLYGYDHAGELLWRRDLGVLDCGATGLPEELHAGYQWGFASSPVLHGQLVIVQCDVQDQSFVAALDARTGEEIWRTPRDEDPTWCTPTVDVGVGRSQVILNGYKHIGGYDLETGVELWMLVGGGDVPVPTPVVCGETIFLTSAHGPLRPLYALDAHAEGELTSDPEQTEALGWYHPRQGIYMQTPLVYGAELYACSDGGILACYDAETGEQLYRERLGSGRTGFSASAIAADGKVYFTDESGRVYVVRAGPVFELLAENELGETCMATPAVSKGSLIFRTVGYVLAVGAPGTRP